VLVSDDRDVESREASGHVEDEAATWLKESPECNVRRAMLLGGQNGEEMDDHDAVELLCWGGTRDCVGEVEVVDVRENAVNLRGGVAVGTDRKPLLLGP
jgi:hypothetical protein